MFSLLSAGSGHKFVYLIWVTGLLLGSFSAGGGRSSGEAWYTTALDAEESLSGIVDSDVHIFVVDVVEYFDTVDRSVLNCVLSSLGASLVSTCVF